MKKSEEYIQFFFLILFPVIAFGIASLIFFMNAIKTQKNIPSLHPTNFELFQKLVPNSLRNPSFSFHHQLENNNEKH